MYELIITDFTDPENNIELGIHEFVAIPRIGEHIILAHDGPYKAYEVFQVTYAEGALQTVVWVRDPQNIGMPYIVPDK